MAGNFKMYPPVSKAGSPKTTKWSAKDRFSTGHDAGCMALLPEHEKINGPVRVGRRLSRNKIGVYRATTFGMTKDQRLQHDAQLLLKAGGAETIEEALEKVRIQYERKDSTLGCATANI